jgi:DNA-binding GntR family transcriptional regulator
MTQTNLAHRVNAIQSTAEVIAQSLKEMIYEAELKPGQPLIQERIAEMFQVSRVPVRDALRMLIGIGIVINVPRRGVIVRPLSQKLLDDLFEVRKILEGAGIRLVLRSATPELPRRLEELIQQQSECLKTGDVKQYGKLDEEFHRTEFEAAGNLRLVELIRSNWEMIKQARTASIVVPKYGKAWMATSIKRHKRILAALMQRDEGIAHSIIVENIESSKREITACLRDLGWIETTSRREAQPDRMRSTADLSARTPHNPPRNGSTG